MAIRSYQPRSQSKLWKFPVQWNPFKPATLGRGGNVRFRARLYGLGHPRQPSLRGYPGRVIFLLISLKSSINRLHEVGETTRVGGTTREASCLVSAGRVTLASGTTFSHVNTLARLPGQFFYAHFKMAATYRHRLVTSKQRRLVLGTTQIQGPSRNICIISLQYKTV